ncbi:MAG: type II toxin-antitoxin system RelE/ParE family toxin [Acidobacteria bacterium]|nr:type II toxin-antitoxin system RelE/ParE family toxin [Acidobacteriota bacterium]
MRLLITATAARQIRDADDWWAEHRTAAPRLLRAELNRAFHLITSQPQAGSCAENVELPDVRRVLLRRTRYHVYYRASQGVVRIIGFWHASRGSTPDLPGG